MPHPMRRYAPISDEEEARIQAGIAQDPDNPELTEEELTSLRPAKEVLPPALYEKLLKRRRGERGAGRKPAKISVTMRLDPDVVERWRASGPGWQTRVNAVLRKARVD